MDNRSHDWFSIWSLAGIWSNPFQFADQRWGTQENVNHLEECTIPN
ncbi:unnamed protein product [Brassica rapa]|uniref:Uncharacterized protein n=1 Tax=Brassica campestris TaxID=3711 RepID=A0A3P6BFJ9_BRACM|nr:unnamed protein product [Brassica rapa]VDC97844.1 unnamed protein product [Brassica rapa]